MTAAVECRYCGRDFTAQDMALLRALIAADPPPNRHALSRKFCRRIGWFKPDGGLKDMMARVTMLAMHKDGLIVLPPPKWPRPPRRPMVFGPDTEPPAHPSPTSLDAVRPLDLRPAVRYSREGKLWNENTPAEGPRGCLARLRLKNYASSRHMYAGLSHPPKLASGTAVRPFTYEPTASM